MISSSRPASILSPHKSWDDTSGRSQELDMSPSRLGEFDVYHPLRRRAGLTGLTGFDSLTAGQREDSLLDLDEVSRGVGSYMYTMVMSVKEDPLTIPI